MNLSSNKVKILFVFVPALFALILGFQNCSSTKFTNDGEKSLSVDSTAIPDIATDGTDVRCNQPCISGNGSGVQLCDQQGRPTACQIEACDSGYVLSGNICVASCSPNSTRSCVINNGKGAQVCNSQGTAWSQCKLIRCNPSFHFENGACVPNTCSPNKIENCTGLNGNGTKVCQAGHGAWGVCTLKYCDSGYHFEDGKCVADACAPGSFNKCQGLNGSGEQSCNSKGTGWNSCQLRQCEEGFTLQNGVCVHKPVVLEFAANPAACENFPVRISCPSGRSLTVLSSTYGGNCGAPANYGLNAVQGLCGGKNSCSFTAGNSDSCGGNGPFLDPHFGCAKDYKMTYICQ